MKKHFVQLSFTIPLFALLCRATVSAEGSEGDAALAPLQTSGSMWVYLCLAGFAVLAAVLLVVCVILKKDTGGSVMGGSDKLTGMKSARYVKQSYGNSVETGDAYICRVYLAKNYSLSVEHFGQRQCETLLKGEADILKNFCQSYDSVSMMEKGIFLLKIQCRDGLHAEHRVAELIKALNHYQYQTVSEIFAPFAAGICLPETIPLTFASALSRAKLAYGYACDNFIPFFTCTDDLVRNEVSRNKLRERLINAMDAGQFDMFLQFIYDVKKKAFTSAEVLSRWNNPEEGFLLPAAYINDMRTTGVMERFDYYMLEKVCRQLAEWDKNKFSILSLSCNITRITISSSEFIKHFLSILSKYKFDHSKLILEMTEDALIESESMARKNIMECKTQGCRVAIDDFGFGSTSLMELNDYPVDMIKVDRHVISRTTGNERGNVILRSVVDLAHQLDMTVVCEGVETKRQADIVIKNQCDYIQGYYYSYVMPMEEAMNRSLDDVHTEDAAKTE